MSTEFGISQQYWPVIPILMLYPETDRQNAKINSCKHGLRHSCQPQKITRLNLLKQQKKKKFLQISNFGKLTPLQTDQNKDPQQYLQQQKSFFTAPVSSKCPHTAHNVLHKSAVALPKKN